MVLPDFYRHLKGETQIVTEERVQRGMLKIRRKNYENIE